MPDWSGPPATRLEVRALPTLLGLAVSAVALAIVVRSVDVAEAARILTLASPLPLLVAVGVIAIQVLLVSARWRLLLPRTPRLAPLVDVVRSVLTGYLANAVLPGRMGELVRSYVVSRLAALPLPETLGSVVLERLIDVATLAVLLLGFAVLSGMPGWVVSIAAIAAVAGALCLGLLVTVGFEPVVRLFRRLTTRWRDGRVGVWLGRGERVLLGASGARRRTAVALAIAATAGTALLEAVVFWLVSASLGLGLTYAEAFTIAAVVVIGTAIPSAPGYLGTYEAAAVAMAVAMGVPEAAALAMAVLVHATTLLPLALGGVVSATTLAVGPSRRLRRPQPQPQRPDGIRPAVAPTPKAD